MYNIQFRSEHLLDVASHGLEWLASQPCMHEPACRAACQETGYHAIMTVIMLVKHFQFIPQKLQLRPPELGK